MMAAKVWRRRPKRGVPTCRSPIQGGRSSGTSWRLRERHIRKLDTRRGARAHLDRHPAQKRARSVPVAGCLELRVRRAARACCRS